MSQREGINSNRFKVIPVLAAGSLLLAPVMVISQAQLEWPEYIRSISLIPLILGVAFTIYWLRYEKTEEIEIATPVVDGLPYSAAYYDEILLTEYMELGDERRYRERFAVNTTYFSVAVQAVVANLFGNLEPLFFPLIASIGLIVAFSFGMMASGYYTTRDRIENRQRMIERHETTRGILSTLYTIRTSPGQNGPVVDTVKIGLYKSHLGLHFFSASVWMFTYFYMMGSAVLW